MLHQVLDHRAPGCTVDPSVVFVAATPDLACNAATAPDPIIWRRPDGSINYDHYDRTARGLRAHDQRAALKILLAPVQWLLGALQPRASKRTRPVIGSQDWQPNR